MKEGKKVFVMRFFVKDSFFYDNSEDNVYLENSKWG